MTRSLALLGILLGLSGFSYGMEFEKLEKFEEVKEELEFGRRSLPRNPVEKLLQEYANRMTWNNLQISLEYYPDYKASTILTNNKARLTELREEIKKLDDNIKLLPGNPDFRDNPDKHGRRRILFFDLLKFSRAVDKLPDHERDNQIAGAMDIFGIRDVGTVLRPKYKSELAKINRVKRYIHGLNI